MQMISDRHQEGRGEGTHDVSLDRAIPYARDPSCTKHGKVLGDSKVDGKVTLLSVSEGLEEDETVSEGFASS